jgi:hypothetical protein
MGIFATFPSDNKKTGYSKVLLTFSSMGDENNLTAEMHFNFTSFVLKLYGKDWGNVVALIGDNCPTNKAFAQHAQCKLIGCANHWFNLAVKDIFHPYDSVIAQVYQLMKN